jgi:formate dehydrogenase iron-sulfur subunit
VIGFHSDTGTVRKCTLCYDRLQAGMQPACAQACPTQSIRFGPMVELHARADARLVALQTQGHGPILYGRDDSVYGGLGAFFLLMDKPETYGLPSTASAVRPGRNNGSGYLGALIGSVLAVAGGLIAFRRRGETEGR